MTNTPTPGRTLLTSLALCFMIGNSPIGIAHSNASSAKFPIQPAAQLASAKIPETPQPCETVECKWWEQLRAAAIETEQAYIRKEQEIAEVYRKAPRRGFAIGGGDVILPPDFPDLVARLNADIERTTTAFLNLVREGTEKSYAIPVGNSRPVMIRKHKAKYTEEARARKIQGEVKLSAVFQADGVVSDIKVIKGLDGGLTESAIEATKQILFLPAIRNSKFASVRNGIGCDFTLY